MTDLYRIAEGDCRDELGMDRAGHPGTMTHISPMYAYIALTCNPGVTVRVLRSSLVLVDPAPETADEARARLAWEWEHAA